MKTNMSISGGVMTIETIDNMFSAEIDIQTGEVLHFDFTQANAHQVAAFATKVKSRYNKFLRSKEVLDFID